MSINVNVNKDNPFNIDKSKLVDGLDDEQFAAVIYNNDENLLCNAIAGSGKTHVLTTRVAWLIASGVEPSKIMLLTFTNKAAKEMLERVSGKFNNIPIGVKAGTFHSMGSRYLRRFSNVIGYGHNFTILDQADSRELIGQIRSHHLDKIEADKQYRKEFAKATNIQNAYTKKINLRLNLEFLELPKNQLDDIKHILREYDRIKKEANLMDFDDLLVNFDKILDNKEVREQIQSEISHVLVDEYQDINYLQDKIIQKISNKERVFAVGDPSQSIYAFRGSNISYIEDFTDEYNCEEINLKNNYRSDKNILQLAENAINKNPQRNLVEMRAFRDTNYEQNYNEYYTTFIEIDAIVDKILELIDNGVKRSEIAILIRSSSPNAFMLEAAIRKAKIPYELRAGMSYFSKAHIKDMVALITLLVNPKCLISFQRATTLLSGVGPKNATRLYDYYRENNYSFQSSLENLEDSDLTKKVKENFDKLAKVMVLAESKNGVKEPIKAIAGSFYLDYLKNKYGEDDDYADRLQDIIDIPNITDAQNLSDFLENISLDSERLEGEQEDGDKIIISTMHRSKGLEWDYVFIPFLFIGNFPNKVDDPVKVEEERRLFYVSLTRARKTLYLSKAKYNANYDYLPDSIFLKDAGLF